MGHFCLGTLLLRPPDTECGLEAERTGHGVAMLHARPAGTAGLTAAAGSDSTLRVRHISLELQEKMFMLNIVAAAIPVFADV